MNEGFASAVWISSCAAVASSAMKPRPLQVWQVFMRPTWSGEVPSAPRNPVPLHSVHVCIMIAYADSFFWRFTSAMSAMLSSLASLLALMKATTALIVGSESVIAFSPTSSSQFHC